MGGCCSSGRSEVDRAPLYFYCPPILEQPFSSTHGVAASFSSCVLVDTNLDTTSIDTFQAPPPPLPYDIGLPCLENLPGNAGDDNKTSPAAPITSSTDAENDASDIEVLTVCDGSKKHISKDKIKSAEVDNVNLIIEEEEECPICLEEYDMENPRISTKCEHHFHFSCILEWIERSNICPICDQIVIFNNDIT